MGITSASTWDEVTAQFDDNLSYMTTRDVAKCRLFIEACIAMIRRRPTEVRDQGKISRWSESMLQRELDQARTWLINNDDTQMPNAVTRGDLRDADL